MPPKTVCTNGRVPPAVILESTSKLAKAQPQIKIA
jgi:hypothetical protein